MAQTVKNLLAMRETQVGSLSQEDALEMEMVMTEQIKRCLLLGRKVMTNLDSILKRRDITLSTKVLVVKAMIFPVVMYGCESWTIKEADR